VIRARHRLGATLVFASAATISVGAHALPVYEIYKVGQDVHIVDGLSLFSDFGLHVSFIPHWNNADGGADLDTSRCFVGMERFAEWCSLVPADNETIGLDEHTGLIIDFESGLCEVSGVSSVSLVRECNPEMYASGSKFSLSELGEFRSPEPIERDIPAHVWEMCVSVPPLAAEQPSGEVLELANRRARARTNRDWAESDKLRDEIAAHGWTVQDSKDGSKLVKNS
jgi:hypothetical protein